MFDDEDTLLLRPLAGALDTRRVEEELAGIPGSFPDPHEPRTWVLVVPAYDARRTLAWRKEHPRTHTWEARVSLLPDDVVVVVPGLGILSWGRAQKFVRWLLTLGPFQLEVRGEDVGRVTSFSDVYAHTWPDPDATDDPTESPPRVGRLTTLRREPDGSGGEVAVHDSGAMSYTAQEAGAPRIWRARLAPDLHARWPALLEALPMNADEPGPGDVYTDLVYLTVEIPTDDDEVKLDVAHLPPQYREIVGLLDGWGAALSRDGRQAPAGLTDLVSPER